MLVFTHPYKFCIETLSIVPNKPWWAMFSLEHHGEIIVLGKLYKTTIIILGRNRACFVHSHLA
jgi:hypothetical protein